MATENNATFSLEEIGRALYHTGHPLQNPVLTLSLGVPSLTQPAFLVYGAMFRVPDSQAAVIRRLLGILDQTDNRIFEAQEQLAASKLGEMELNLEICNYLEAEYTRWAKRFADALGCILNPYSERFNGGKAPINVRVRHG